MTTPADRASTHAHFILDTIQPEDRHALDGLLDHLISVDAVRRYKTAPEAYALGEAALGRPAREILFVSSNGWDALAATWYGYRTLWVNRQQLPFEELGTRPSHEGRSLEDVLPLVLPGAATRR